MYACINLFSHVLYIIYLDAGGSACFPLHSVVLHKRELMGDICDDAVFSPTVHHLTFDLALVFAR